MLLLAVTLVVIAFVLLRGGGSNYEVRALVESAGQLVKGNLVKVGGVTVGSVHAIDLTSDNQAQITLRIDDARFKPLHEGTIATIRNTSLSSVAGRQVVLQPGPNSNPAIGDGGVIKGENTRPIVDLDQLLNTLDAQARTFTEEMALAAANAIADSVGAEKINPSVIVPSVFDARVAPAVAAAVRATVRGGRLDPEPDPSEG